MTSQMLKDVWCVILLNFLPIFCLAKIRCPPYSLTFADFGVPDCEPSFTINTQEELDNIIKKLVCFGYGTWKVPPAKGCSSPEEIPAGMEITYPCRCGFGGTCAIKCRAGYELIGKATIECREDTSSYLFESSCEKLVCSTPSLPERVEAVEGKCNMTGECEVTCISEEYRMIGENLITCLGRTWSEYPSCIAVCKLDEIADYLKPKGLCSGDQGEMCPIECVDSSLTLNGPINVVCNPDGQWSKMPACGCDQVFLPVSVLLPVACSMAAGGNCAAACSPDYVKDENSVEEIHCGADGKWDVTTSIKCLRKCPELLTALPENVVAFPGCLNVQGHTCQVNCNTTSLRLIGASSVECLATGKYSDMPHCTTIEHCPDDVFTNMDIGDCSFRTGLTCSLSCVDPNYRLIGGNTVTCETTGNWNQVPVCKRTCPMPGMEDKISENCNNLEEDTCTLRCMEGYIPTIPKTITCLGNGDWSDTLICVRQCPELTLPGDIVLAQECSRTANTSCELVCKESNYKIMPTNKILCNISGIWEEVPECKKLCNGPNFQDTDFKLADENATCNFVIGNGCPIKCSDSNLLIVGPGIVECTESGQSFGTSACSSPCGTPRLPNDVVYETSCVTDQASSYCPIRCTNELSNEPLGNATCEMGQWTISINCEVRCEDISLHPGSRVKSECSNLEGSECIIVCNGPNDFMNGQREVTVLCNNKIWTEAPPCETQCSPFIAPPDLKVIEPCEVKNSTTCEVVCKDSEANFEGNPTFVCNAPDWIGETPICYYLCDHPNLPSNLELVGNCSMRMNKACEIKCPPGLRVDGDNKITCLPTLSWSTFPGCSNLCSKLQRPLKPLTDCSRQPNTECLLSCRAYSTYSYSYNPDHDLEEGLVPTSLSMRCMPNLEWEPKGVHCIKGESCSYWSTSTFVARIPCYNGQKCRLTCYEPEFYLSSRFLPLCKDGKIDESEFPHRLCRLQSLYDECPSVRSTLGEGLDIRGSNYMDLFEFRDVYCKDPEAVLVGKTRVQCVFGGKVGTQPTCEKKCNRALLTEKNLIINDDFCKSYGKHFCAISCPAGKVPVDFTMAECGANGTWSKIPTCADQAETYTPDCPTLNTTLKVNKTLAPGLLALDCWDPYNTLVGPPVIFCQPNKKWTRMPECKPTIELNSYATCVSPNVMDDELGEDSDCPVKTVYTEMDYCATVMTCEVMMERESTVVKGYCLPNGQWSIGDCPPEFKLF